MLIPPQQVTSGPLNVSVARDGGRWTISLEGELDLATADPVQRQLEAAMADPTCDRVVLDMSRLEFIDSTGIAVLMRAMRHDAGFDRLRCVPSQALGVSRVLELTGVGARLSELETA